MAQHEQVERVSAEFARDWWKTLMANSCALLKDGAILAAHGSAGRAQALLVLAMEELAKARWLYDAAEYEWSRPLGLYGLPSTKSGTVLLPSELSTRRLPHLQKLQAAEQFSSGLGGFWDASRREEYYFPADLITFEEAARRRNADKQAGFYVDRLGDAVLTPLAIPSEGIDPFLRRAAQSLEMHLIEDHTRQQDAVAVHAIDSVQDLHWEVLPYAHPELFADFADRIGDVAGPAAEAEGE
ncbi:UNVERIFIED_ORG: AbiV family abortive infection protein [Bacillus sp. AZ43]|nr:AbiV family abortive infection protein [Geodermatophilus sp. LHW52908]